MTAPPRLHLRKLSLRLALGLVAIAGMGVGWFAYRVRVQQEGIELIRRHGGMYYYDFEHDGATFPKLPSSWAPKWLIKYLGIDCFHHVTWVRIEDRQFDDEGLRRLTACLPRIESLGIVDTSITDSGLAHLSKNQRLMALFLSSNRITDAGIDNLDPATMPILELLDVRGTRVSAAKVVAVEGIFSARESKARKAYPKTWISTHMVLSGSAPPPMGLGRDPRGEYQRSLTVTQPKR